MRTKRNLCNKSEMGKLILQGIWLEIKSMFFPAIITTLLTLLILLFSKLWLHLQNEIPFNSSYYNSSTYIGLIPTLWLLIFLRVRFLWYIFEPKITFISNKLYFSIKRR